METQEKFVKTKLTIKTVEWRHWRRSGFLFAKFEQIKKQISNLGLGVSITDF